MPDKVWSPLRLPPPTTPSTASAPAVVLVLRPLYCCSDDCNRDNCACTAWWWPFVIERSLPDDDAPLLTLMLSGLFLPLPPLDIGLLWKPSSLLATGVEACGDEAAGRLNSVKPATCWARLAWRLNLLDNRFSKCGVKRGYASSFGCLLTSWHANFSSFSPLPLWRADGWIHMSTKQ